VGQRGEERQSRVTQRVIFFKNVCAYTFFTSFLHVNFFELFFFKFAIHVRACAHFGHIAPLTRANAHHTHARKRTSNTRTHKLATDSTDTQTHTYRPDTQTHTHTGTDTQTQTDTNTHTPHIHTHL